MTPIQQQSDRMRKMTVAEVLASDLPQDVKDLAAAPAPAFVDPAAPAKPSAGPPPDAPACVRCGWRHSAPYHVEVTPADKTLFVESLVSGTPFRRSYPLFGGKGRVVFQELVPEVDQKIAETAAALVEGKPAATAAMIALIEVRRRRLAAAVYSLEADGRVLFQAGDDWQDAAARFSRAVPGSAQQAMLLSKHDEFADLTKLLQERAFDPDF